MSRTRMIKKIAKRHAMNGFGSMGETIHSDHQAFFAGSEMGASVGETLKNFFAPVATQVITNTQAGLVQAGTNVINNQLAKNPALQQKSEDTIAETIKGAILKNKWYIIGGLAGLGIFFVVLNRYSSKK